MSDVATIRASIWAAANQDSGLINRCKAGIALEPGTVAYYEALLRKVQEETKPAKRRKKASGAILSQAAKDRYRAAKYAYEEVKFKPWCQDGHFIEPDYPDAGTKKGIDDYIVNFLKWNGHFANPTNNRGLMVEKDGEKKWLKSGANKGMQDIDATLKHPDHPFGIPWKIETKTPNDRQSKHQQKFEKKVKATAGVYSLVWGIDDFLSQYDSLMVRENVLF